MPPLQNHERSDCASLLKSNVYSITKPQALPAKLIIMARSTFGAMHSRFVAVLYCLARRTDVLLHTQLGSRR